MGILLCMLGWLHPFLLRLPNPNNLRVVELHVLDRSGKVPTGPLDFLVERVRQSLREKVEGKFTRLSSFSFRAPRLDNTMPGLALPR